MKIFNSIKGALGGLFLLLSITAQAQNDWGIVLTQSYDFWEFCETSNGDMFCTRDNRWIMKSTNSGNTWTVLTTNNGITSNNYNHIATYQNKLFLYNRDYSGLPVARPKGFFVSTNGGTNWTQKNNGLGADTVIYDMDVTKNGLLFIIAAATEGATSFKLYRSANFGDTWTYLQTVPDKFFYTSIATRSDGSMYFQSYNAFYKSTNQGTSWTNLTTTNLSDINFLQVGTNDSLYAFRATELYRSIDGVNWTQNIITNWPSEITFSDNLVDAFLILPNNTYFATIGGTAGANSGIYKSTDMGKTWSTFNTGMNGNRQVLGSRLWYSSKTGYMFASPSLTGIYKTTSIVSTPTSIFSPVIVDNYSLKVGPNPTANFTNLTYTLKSSEYVSIEVLDAQGRLVSTIIKEEIQNAGEQQRTIDLSNLFPGVYMIQVRTTNDSSVKRVVVE